MADTESRPAFGRQLIEGLDRRRELLLPGHDDLHEPEGQRRAVPIMPPRLTHAGRVRTRLPRLLNPTRPASTRSTAGLMGAVRRPGGPVPEPGERGEREDDLGGYVEELHYLQGQVQARAVLLHLRRSPSPGLTRPSRARAARHPRRRRRTLDPCTRTCASATAEAATAGSNNREHQGHRRRPRRRPRRQRHQHRALRPARLTGWLRRSKRRWVRPCDLRGAGRRWRDGQDMAVPRRLAQVVQARERLR